MPSTSTCLIYFCNHHLIFAALEKDSGNTHELSNGAEYDNKPKHLSERDTNSQKIDAFDMGM